jgi:biopolymer transport protein ExbB
MQADFIKEVLKLWADGGWCMVPLAFQTLAIYYIAFALFFEIRGHPALRTSEDEWGHWIDRPDDAKGEIAHIFRYTQQGVTSLDTIRQRFVEVTKAYLPALDRRIRFVFMIAGTAPLTGLLGTVTGMLATFHGIAGGAGGADTVDVVAGGISEALITTETGLVIAIPAYVVLARIRRLRDQLELFLRRAETMTLRRFARALPGDPDAAALPPHGTPPHSGPTSPEDLPLPLPSIQPAT